MDTNDDMRESGEPEAPSAPTRPTKTNPSGKKSVLRQRLRHELDSFNFNALIQGVSTIKPAEETPAPQAAAPELAAPLRAEDASAATLAEEPRSEPVAAAVPTNEPSVWAVVRTPANFPGFDLEPRRSANPRLAMASAYARAVASTPAANPRLQASRNALQPQRPPVVNPNRKIVRGKQRRHGRNFRLFSLLTAVLMLAGGVAAALRWRVHTLPPAPHAVATPIHSTQITKLESGGQQLVSSTPIATPSPPSLHRRHHRRRRRRHHIQE